MVPKKCQRNLKKVIKFTCGNCGVTGPDAVTEKEAAGRANDLFNPNKLKQNKEPRYGVLIDDEFYDSENFESAENDARCAAEDNPGCEVDVMTTMRRYYLPEPTEADVIEWDVPFIGV